MTPVADAMIRFPKICGVGTTIGEVREQFDDDHVHAVLVVDHSGRLVAVVERPDAAHGLPDVPALRVGRVRGRVISPDADLEGVWQAMLGQGRRRLAVVDDHGVLLGLLCLKRSGLGFCTDAGIQARAEERACMPAST